MDLGLGADGLLSFSNAASALINGVGPYGINFGALTFFAQFLIIGVDLLTPIFYMWASYDEKVQLSKTRRNPSVDKGRRTRGRGRSILNFGDNSDSENIYDFIVVGSGSAGAVVAHRLSQSHNVLLLEAGGVPNFFTRLPILAFLLQGRPPIDWMFRTVPQTHACKGMTDQVSFWPAGKGLGGSSNINGLIFLRGLVQGFDTLANSTGNPKWSMENILKFYKNIEDYKGYFPNSIDHGSGGHLSIEKAHIHKITEQYLKAGEDLGYRIRDPNIYGPLTEGFAPMDLYIKNGRRWSSYEGYLKDIIETRKSLTVKKYATVTKVLLDANKNAYGVEYFQDGKFKIAKASKEVVLSAGTIQTGKLLLLSGIGPKKHLAEHGIESRVDLPVGNVLQDKYGVLLGPFTSAPGTSFLRERDLTVKSTLDWATRGAGPAQGSRAEATFTISSSYSKRETPTGIDWPDIHTYLLTWSIDERFHQDLSQAFNIKPHILDSYFRLAKNQDSFMQMVTINKPTGTGTLRLRSKDPFDSPLIDPKYLQHPKDVAILVEAIKFAVKLVEETPSFKAINGSILPVPLPGCEHHAFKTDSYWECVGRHLTLTAFKYAGTAPIGKSDGTDPEAVVDSELRVIGTTGLRIIDASVLQIRQLSVNHVTVQTVAELGSTFILDYWKVQEKRRRNKWKY